GIRPAKVDLGHGGVDQPLVVSFPRPQFFGGDKFPDRLRRGAAMKADLAREVRQRVDVKGALVVVPRPPDVLLGEVVEAPLKSLSIAVGRTRQVGSCRIVPSDRGRQYLPGEPVVVGIAPEPRPRVGAVDFVVARPQDDRRVESSMVTSYKWGSPMVRGHHNRQLSTRASSIPA